MRRGGQWVLVSLLPELRGGATHFAVGSAARAAWKAMETKDSPRTLKKTCEARVPSSLRISLGVLMSVKLLVEERDYALTLRHPTAKDNFLFGQ